MDGIQNWNIIKELNNDFLQCECKKCKIVHTINKSNINNAQCLTCTVDANPINDVLTLLSNTIGLSKDKQQQVVNTIAQLKELGFNDIYTSLEQTSKAMKEVMTGGQSPEVSKKILEKQSNYLKEMIDQSIKDGKITKEEVNSFSNKFKTSNNFDKLKDLMNELKKQVNEKTKL